MRFISVPKRNLFRRPLRTLLTILGISAAIAAFVAFDGMSRGVENAWTNTLLERDTHIMAVRKGVIDILSGSIEENYEIRLRQREGVLDVGGELVDLITLESGNPIVVVGWPLGSFLWKTLLLSDGYLPAAEDSTEVVLGQTVAKSMGFKIGDKIKLHNHDCYVAGICRPAGIMKNSTIIVTLKSLQRMVGRPGKVTCFNLRIKAPEDPANLSSILSGLNQGFPDLAFTESKSLTENNRMLKLLRAITWGISTLALFISLIVMANTLLMAVTERIKEIGILSAIGWQPRRILAMILIEGLIMAFIGSLTGFGLGTGILYWFSQFPQVRGFIEPTFTLPMIFKVMVGAFILGTMGSLFPAWKAIRLQPAEALRHE